VERNKKKLRSTLLTEIYVTNADLYKHYWRNFPSVMQR